MAKLKRPTVDMHAVRSGDQSALMLALTACAARWFVMADSHITFRANASCVAEKGGTAQAGLLAAGIDLRDLLAQCPSGREALRDFGFEPVLQYVEGK